MLTDDVIPPVMLISQVLHQNVYTDVALSYASNPRNVKKDNKMKSVDSAFLNQRGMPMQPIQVSLPISMYLSISVLKSLTLSGTFCNSPYH